MKRIHLIGAGLSLLVVIAVTGWWIYADQWLLSSDLMTALTGYVIAALTAARYEVAREREVSSQIERALMREPPRVEAPVDPDQTPVDPDQRPTQGMRD